MLSTMPGTQPAGREIYGFATAMSGWRWDPVWTWIQVWAPHHSDGVVEQGLPEDKDVQQLIDVDLLEDGQHGHRVHGGDDAAKEQVVQEPDVVDLLAAHQAHGVHETAQEEGVPQRAHHGEDQNGAQVLRELPQRQEVAGVQDDGWQQEEEEDVGLQERGRLAHALDQAPHQQPHYDQQAALRDDARDSGDHVETCRGRENGRLWACGGWREEQLVPGAWPQRAALVAL